MGVIPDLSTTIIDSETGEVLHQGLEGPEIDALRKRHNEGLAEIFRRNTKAIEAKKMQQAAGDSSPDVTAETAKE